MGASGQLERRLHKEAQVFASGLLSIVVISLRNCQSSIRQSAMGKFPDLFCLPKGRPALRPLRRLAWYLFLVLLLPWPLKGVQPIHYSLDLTAPETHLVRVGMSIPDAAANTEVQIPAWNCLYQIRDFEKDVEDVKAECDGEPVELYRPDLNTWSGPARPCRNLSLNYSVYADTEGPFDSVLNSGHAFLNLAMVLFYLPGERQRPVQVRFVIPQGWKLATFLNSEGDDVQAADYDALVDSPIEAGHFEDFSYSQDFLPAGAPAATGMKHATIRVIVDANRADYSSARILSSLQRITREETTLMQDLPFSHYTFLLHFPREGSSTGGMEHLNGTAIGISASDLRNNFPGFENVAAHELFHAWNVKRIRPQLLEPVDYIHGNDTRDLWFCEGITNTYAELVLLRAGLIDRDLFYRRMAAAIENLQVRSARTLQSVETSGREAWLEKYSDYNRPERSVSYYNKGELLGYLLDLGMRHATQNRAGLDDLMRRLNQDFARRGRFYTLADLKTLVAQLAPGFDVNQFVAEDVSGTAELDYSMYLGYAGLRAVTQIVELPEPGFSASRDNSGLLQVDSVEPGSDAEQAGLQPGDVLLKSNEDSLPAGGGSGIPTWRPGQTVELQISRSGTTHALKFQVGGIRQMSAEIEEDPVPSPEQLRVRQGWLTGVTNPGKP